MKRNIILTFLVLIVLFTIVKYTVNRQGGLVGSTLMQQTPIPTPVATPNAPKTFQFDSSTDLKMELEKVNPQILDSDFQ